MHPVHRSVASSYSIESVQSFESIECSGAERQTPGHRTSYNEKIERVYRLSRCRRPLVVVRPLSAQYTELELYKIQKSKK